MHKIINSVLASHVILISLLSLSQCIVGSPSLLFSACITFTVIYQTYLPSYLNRTGQIGCFNTQVDQTANGKANEQPVIEAKVINQLEDIFYTQEYEGHAALKGKEKENTQH